MARVAFYLVPREGSNAVDAAQVRQPAPDELAAAVDHAESVERALGRAHAEIRELHAALGRRNRELDRLKRVVSTLKQDSFAVTTSAVVAALDAPASGVAARLDEAALRRAIATLRHAHAQASSKIEALRAEIATRRVHGDFKTAEAAWYRDWFRAAATAGYRECARLRAENVWLRAQVRITAEKGSP